MVEMRRGLCQVCEEPAMDWCCPRCWRLVPDAIRSRVNSHCAAERVVGKREAINHAREAWETARTQTTLELEV